MNRYLNVEYLGKALCIPNHKDNILMRNMYTLLIYDEVVALSRLLTILNLSILLHMRWLAGKTHELAKYKCEPVSVCKAMDTMRDALIEVQKKSKTHTQ